MRILLDSHAFLWLAFASPRLSATAKRAILDATEVCLSHASIWEMTIKQSLGRLALSDDLQEIANNSGVVLLPITLAHIQAIALLPHHHGDPFDRMLIAQAREEGMTLVTADALIQRYPVAWLW